MNVDRIVDLSMPCYTGVPAPMPGVTFIAKATHADSNRFMGYPFASNMCLLPEHCGTHIDAFYHFKEDGQTIDQIDIRRFVLPARVVNLTNKRGREPITDEDLSRACTDQEVEIIKGGALLVYSRKDPEWYSEQKKAYDMPFLVESAARWIHEQGWSMVGQDVIGFENPDVAPENLVHRYLLTRDVILLEGLCNLNKVASKRFTLFAVPVKWRGTGAQCRAFALLES